jgi:hypothetical protein
LVFDESGFGDHADPQLRAFVGVWAFERGEVGTAQLGVYVVPGPDFVGYGRLRARLEQQRAHTTVAQATVETTVRADDQTLAPGRQADDGGLHLVSQTIMEFTMQRKQIRGPVTEVVKERTFRHSGVLDYEIDTQSGQAGALGQP